jgi:hypothetical protein
MMVILWHVYEAASFTGSANERLICKLSFLPRGCGHLCGYNVYARGKFTNVWNDYFGADVCWYDHRSGRSSTGSVGVPGQCKGRPELPSLQSKTLFLWDQEACGPLDQMLDSCVPTCGQLGSLLAPTPTGVMDCATYLPLTTLVAYLVGSGEWQKQSTGLCPVRIGCYS